MAMKYGCSILAMFVAVIACAAVVGESKSAPAPVDCTTVVLGMSDCLSYVTNGSTVEKPEGNCCSGLKSVLKTNAECLCEGFKSSSQFGVVLNVTKALALPGACHVHAPDAAKCGLSLSPTGAPTQSPAAGGALGVSPTGAPSGTAGADTPSGAAGADAPSGAAGANAPSSGIGGSEVSPASSPGSAGSSSVIGIPVQLIVVGLAAAFFS